ARLNAIEAIAHHMRCGKSFTDAKKEVFARAKSVHKFSRPELYAGILACVENVQFSDLPEDIIRMIEDDFLASIERRRGYKAGPIERAFYRLTGHVFRVDPKPSRGRRKG